MTLGRPLWYKLDGNKNPVPVKRLRDSKEDNRVAETTIKLLGVNLCWVSTVFIFMDHSHSDDGPPVLFETVVFGGIFHDYMRRYHTWSEAEAGHEAVVKMVKDPMQMVKHLLGNIWWFFELRVRRLAWKIRRIKRRTRK